MLSSTNLGLPTGGKMDDSLELELVFEKSIERFTDDVLQVILRVGIALNIIVNSGAVLFFF